MRLIWPLSLCLLFFTSLAYAEKLVVEKIVSDATAIETIVFESAPSHSNRTPTSSVTANSKYVIVMDDTLEGGSQQKVAQLSQRSSLDPSQSSSLGPPQSSSQEFYTLPDTSSGIDPLLQVVTLVKVDKSKRRMYLLKGEEVVQEFRIAL
ncbi:hypothetical protein AB4529_17715, partial [Vibrio splendidus]